MKDVFKKSGLFFITFINLMAVMLGLYLIIFGVKGFFASGPGYVFLWGLASCLGLDIIYTLIFGVIAFSIKNKISLSYTSSFFIAATNAILLMVYGVLDLRIRNLFIIAVILLSLHLLSWAIWCGIRRVRTYF